MNILVTGGGGFVGRHLCSSFAERGHDLTVLSRTPDASVLSEETETVAGDVRSYDSIEPAFAGHDVVVNLVALSPPFQPPEGKLTRRFTLTGPETSLGLPRSTE